VDVAQLDDGPLALGQLAERCASTSRNSRGQQRGLGIGLDRHGLVAPVPGQSGSSSPRNRSGSTVGPPARRSSGPPLAVAAGDVDEDPEHPGPQLGAALEPVERAQHAEPRLLHDLLGVAWLCTWARATRSIAATMPHDSANATWSPARSARRRSVSATQHGRT
jgi:hypothetical protein